MPDTPRGAAPVPAGPAPLPPLAGAGQYPFVSVIVPAFEQPEALRRCLAPLERQTWPPDRYEVIVVDNGSRADLGAVVAEFRRARLVAEPKPGSYAARNHGICVARGQVLAFTDSDCIPAENWIEKGIARLREAPDAGFVAGRVDMFVHDPARPTAAELYDVAVQNFRQDENVRERGFGATANLFTRPEVVVRAGPFDDSLRSAGDLEWGRRVTAAGLRGIYADDARVRHPARRSMAGTLRRAARLAGGTHGLRDRGDGSTARFIGRLIRQLTPAVHFYWRILRRREPARVVDRVKVVLVALAVKYVEAWELIRLRFGGTPHRG
jgi:glycosyltransferase involved in cell wall biosynthesis